MAHDIFICHASGDLKIARAACARLETAQLRCWMAPRDVGPGAYARQLVRAIDGAAAVLVIVSSSANGSEPVLRELEIASKRRKIIVPFRVENVEPNEDLEFFTSRMHSIDAFRPPLDARLDELIAFVRTLIPAGTAPSPAPAAPITKDLDIPRRRRAPPEARGHVAAAAGSEQRTGGSPPASGARFRQVPAIFGLLVLGIVGAIWLEDRFRLPAAPAASPGAVSDAHAYKLRGLADVEKRNFDAAITSYNEAIRLAPKDADAYTDRGIAYYFKGDLDRAIADYNQAIRIDPALARAYNDRGVTYRDKGYLDRAIADYTEAIRLDPKLKVAYFNRGMVEDSGIYLHDTASLRNRAIPDFTEAIRLDPTYGYAYQERSIAYRNLGNGKLAAADYAMAAKLLHLKSTPPPK